MGRQEITCLTSFVAAGIPIAVKEAAKNNKTKSADGEPKVKKPPSAYNLFIKKEMENLKNDGCSPKDRMRKATEKWKEEKEKQKSAVAEEETANE